MGSGELARLCLRHPVNLRVENSGTDIGPTNSISSGLVCEIHAAVIACDQRIAAEIEFKCMLVGMEIISPITAEPMPDLVPGTAAVG